MSWAIVAGLSVAAIGAYTSSQSASAAAGAQNDANRSAAASSAANLAFQQQQYGDHMARVEELEDMFGPIRENLDNYYSNMSPERYQLQGKEALEREYETTNKNIDAMFSNNGMYNSGQMANAKLAMEANREQMMAQNDQNAMNQYQAEQQNWLNSGIQELGVANGLAAGA